VTMPTHAMVLAAGRGTRMKALSRNLPKPLMVVAGRTLLDRTLDRVAAAGIGTAVVNTHYLAEMVETHIATRRTPPEIVLSPESALLETGGGVAAALPLLGDGPFFVHNSDVILPDGPTPSLVRLAETWNGAAMDALLLVHRTPHAIGYSGYGDYFVDAWGRMRRRRGHEVAPYLFTGVQLLHPRLFEGCPEGPFSLNVLYDRAQAAGRLWAVVHDGMWIHVGTPEGLQRANRLLTSPYLFDER